MKTIASLQSTLVIASAWQQRLTRRVHSQGLNLVPRVSHFKGPWEGGKMRNLGNEVVKNFCFKYDLTPLVCRCCHAGTVTNVDFKLCRKVERTVTGCRWKLKAPVVKQKSFELERKGGNFFPGTPERGTNGLSFLRRGKWSSGSEFRRENGLAVQVRFETALSSLNIVYRQLRQNTSKPSQNDEICQMDNRNQARWVCCLHIILKR